MVKYLINPWGPKQLVPILAILFLIGYFGVAEFFFLPYLLLTFFTLSLISLFKKWNGIFLVSLMLCHVLLGVTERPPTNKFPVVAYRIKTLKKQGNHYVQAIAKGYISHDKKLIPTTKQILCRISIKKSILAPGDLIYSTMPVTRIAVDPNPGAFNIKSYYHNKGVDYQSYIGDNYLLLAHEHSITNKMSTFKQCIAAQFEAHLSGESLALGKALILGDANEVSQETKQAFSATGAIHVLAVSGMHVALFAELLLLTFSYCAVQLKRKWLVLTILVVLWGYAWLTGFSPSVIRSVLMFSLVHIGQLLHRKTSANHLLGCCAYLMIIVDPKCIFDIGFQLSFLAVFGIQNYHRRIQDFWRPRNTFLGFIWNHTSVALSAQVLTVPLILYYFHTFPNYFLIANLGIVVLSSLSMYLGFAFLLLNWIPLLNACLGFLFSQALHWMNLFIQCIAALPGAIEGGFTLTNWQVILLYLLVFWLFHSTGNRKIKMLFLTVVISLLAIIRYQNHQEHHIMVIKNKTNDVLLKKGKHAFYITSQKQINDHQTFRVIQQYLSVYPTEHLRIKQLPELGKLTIDEVTFSSHHEGIKVRLKKQVYFIPKRTAQMKTNWVGPGKKLVFNDLTAEEYSLQH